MTHRTPVGRQMRLRRVGRLQRQSGALVSQLSCDNGRRGRT
jgi:hypothetical protein